MRWILAAVSFALLVSLAAMTAAVRATSLDVRLRLQRIEFGLVTHHMEFARRERDLRHKIELAELRRRWQALVRMEQERAAARMQ